MKDCPAIRPDPLTPDPLDGQRVAFARMLWTSQDDALRARDREIEGNVRMLAGQQWAVYSPMFNRYIDVSQYLSEDEKKWRQRPVVNRILPWFILTHARMTENPPVLTMVPGPDALDAIAAETFDTVFKTLWRQLGMPDAMDRLMAWIIVGGRAYTQTRVDPRRGEAFPWVGTAEVMMLDANSATGFLVGPDGQPVTTERDDVPMDEQGNPVGVLDPETGEMVQLAEPYSEPEGELVVDVMSAMECRGEWSPAPWHEKAWHQQKAFLTPEELYLRTGADVLPDTTTVADSGDELRRLLFGSGYFGTTLEQVIGSQTSQGMNAAGGLCEIITTWMKPYKGYPQGRLLVTSPNRVLFDGPRPGQLPFTSPIRAYDFIRIPGRTHGSTPQEAMNALNRAYNRGWAQILEHRNLVTNPKALVDKGSGLGNVEITNEPGEHYEVTRRQGVPPFEWISPPPLGSDVWRTQEMLRSEMDDLGNLRGTEGAPPTQDASGELVKELRLNSDRFLGPTMRQVVTEIGRMGQDWKAMLPLVWTQEKLISYAGEDNVARTIVVMPELFEKGVVNIVPDAESMLPEGRGERQARIYKMWQDGMFGVPPQAPEALKKYFELSRFPHLSRTAKPGGADRPTAERFLGALVSGATTADQLPWKPWYDVTVHLDTFTTFMKAPEFLTLDPMIQMQLEARWQMMSAVLQQQQMAEMQQQLAMAGMAAQAEKGPPGKSVRGEQPSAPSITPPPASGSPPKSLGGKPMPGQLSSSMQ